MSDERVPDKPVGKKADTAMSMTLTSGLDKITDTNIHVGLAIYLSSDNKPSTLMVPDIAAVSTGGPVFITKPIVLKGTNLKKFLKNQKILQPDANDQTSINAKISKLIEDTSISCDAFYYTNSGALLMMFALKFDEGILKDLVGGDIGDLFDIKGAAVRVVRCPSKDALSVLQKYAADLSA